MTDHVSLSFSEVSRNPAHARVNVFVGRNPGRRGLAGKLTLRTDEWDELRTALSVGWSPARTRLDEGDLGDDWRGGS